MNNSNINPTPLFPLLYLSVSALIGLATLPAGVQDRIPAYVNSTFTNPFVSYVTTTKTTFTTGPELTYDWRGKQWLAAVNLVVSQLFTIGKQPIQVALGGRYYFDAPSGGPEWGLRFSVVLLLPK